MMVEPSVVAAQRRIGAGLEAALWCQFPQMVLEEKGYMEWR